MLRILKRREKGEGEGFSDHHALGTPRPAEEASCPQPTFTTWPAVHSQPGDSCPAEASRIGQLSTGATANLGNLASCPQPA